MAMSACGRTRPRQRWRGCWRGGAAGPRCQSRSSSPTPVAKRRLTSHGTAALRLRRVTPTVGRRWLRRRCHGRREKTRRWRRSEEHTSELQSRENLVCRLLLEKKKKTVSKDKALIGTQIKKR